MKLKDLRSEFEVLIVEPVVNTSENYQKIISLAGFRCDECSDPIEAISKVRENPPHIIFFSASDLEASRRQIEALSSISAEFQIILLTNKSQTQRALNLMESETIYDFLALPLTSPFELVVKADKAAEKLYLTFQLEEAQLKHAAKVYEKKTHDESMFPTPPPKSAHHKFESAILKLSMSRDPGQAIATFMQLVSDRIEGRSVAYFKFLPTHFSFVYSEGVGVQVPLGKAVGIDLRNSGYRDPSEIFSQLENIGPIKQMLSSVLKAPKFSILPHAFDGEALGFFVVLGELDANGKEEFRILERLFSIVYQRNILNKSREQLETRDPLTGLTALSVFEKKIKEELSRSRRTGLAFSLVIIEIDNIDQLEDRIGASNTDTILKMIGVIVKKTSRNNDIAGSFSRGRFGLILPHTDSEGAKVRAERLRRMVSTTKFPMNETEGAGLITATAAVGEYPTLSSDSESLVRSTLQVLQRAQEAGGDRLAVVTVPGDFKPDFRPHPVQSPVSFETARGKTK